MGATFNFVLAFTRLVAGGSAVVALKVGGGFWMGRRSRNRRSQYGWGWPPYVPVAERRMEAQAKIARLKKGGTAVNPIEIRGRTIATTFWGKSWCKNLESYSDYANRLPRGRSYVRNGSVLDLQIAEGEVKALVQGSSLYKVEISFHPVDALKWKSIIHECSGKIDSLVELLQGKLSTSVMSIITSPERGLFPSPRQIALNCSCPDWAEMCKHVAATLYGVGARLDEKPELLFLLRRANHLDLIAGVSTAANLTAKSAKRKAKALEESDLSSVFGIELESSSPSDEKRGAGPQVKAKKRRQIQKPKSKSRRK